MWVRIGRDEGGVAGGARPVYRRDTMMRSFPRFTPFFPFRYWPIVAASAE